MSAIGGSVGIFTPENARKQMLKAMKSRGGGETAEFSAKDCVLLRTGGTILNLDAEGEQWSLAWDGSLYNAGELRKELLKLGQPLAGHTTEELVLRCYIRWGKECVRKFNGIFSFAVWANRKQELFLARDRIGVKPLFYTIRNNGLVFGSEIKTVLAHPEIPAELDSQGIAEILLLGPGRTPGSGVFKGIRELEGGCRATFRDGTWREERYWKLTDREHTQTFAETAEYVRYLVMDAIACQFPADGTAGTFLSGGLDSSIISAVCARKMREQGRVPVTFSVDYAKNREFFRPNRFQPNSDPEYARLMAETLGSSHHWTVLESSDLDKALKDAVSARDLPGMADVDSSLLLFCGDIRKQVPIALSGECADEIFGGYPWYRDPAMRNADGFPWTRNEKIRAQFLPPEVSVDPEEFVHSRYEQTLKESDILPENSPEDRRIKELVNLNFRWFMQTLLDRNDRMSSHQGLEVRVPFCDYRIAEYLYSVPWAFKDHGNQEKGLLRKAMEGLLPEKILHRKKSPYPKTFDPAYDTLVRDQLKAVLEDKNAPIHQMVSRKALKTLLEETGSQPWYGQLMSVPQTSAYMLQINFWLQKYQIWMAP